MRLLTDANKKLINDSKASSPYSITLKEWNLFKRLAKDLTPPGCTLKASKDGKWCSATILINDSLVDIPATVCLSVGNGRWVPRYTKEKETLEKDLKDLFRAFDVTYSESDLMTDYYGLYRVNGNASVWCDSKLERVIMTLVGELSKISNTGFQHSDANRIIKELDLPLPLFNE